MWEIATTFFKIIKNLPVLIGAIQAFALAAEVTGNPGEKKKQAVITALEENFKKDFNVDLKPYEAFMSWLIDGVITVFNFLGFFQKKAA